MENSLELLGQRLELARQTRGLTLNDAAEMIEIPRATLYDYEVSRRLPGAENLRAICEGLEVSADFLLGLDPC